MPWPTVTPTFTPLPTATATPRTEAVHLPWLVKGPEDPNPEPTAPPPGPTPPWLGQPAIDVEQYELDLAAPALGETDLRAVVTVTLKARQALDYVDLDAEPRVMQVHRAASESGPPPRKRALDAD